MGSFSNTPNFDNLLLQTLMNRLHLRPTSATSSSSLNQTLEDLLFDNLNLSLSSDTTSSDDEDQTSSADTKSQLAREESRLEKSIIKTILSGEIEETLKPNSGQAVTINEHHICVGFHQDSDSGYRVWEWHGHIMLFDDENGYSPEYIYGNYFERVRDKGGVERERERESEGADEEEVEEEEKSGSLGLKELIGSGDNLGTGRILHRNLNAGSPRF